MAQTVIFVLHILGNREILATAAHSTLTRKWGRCCLLVSCLAVDAAFAWGISVVVVAELSGPLGFERRHWKKPAC